jgi:hypothetical protein
MILAVTLITRLLLLCVEIPILKFNAMNEKLFFLLLTFHGQPISLSRPKLRVRLLFLSLKCKISVL